ncbi:hypothetical protein GCM10010129_02600 [Streptomyces fumigatiscleroticus]|nr:hypothetical protein GCM10010129_02600 [Streptomyces fumigatiscleroticus]
MRIVRRLDTTDQRCIHDSNCPAVFALTTGDVAFIGAEAPELEARLPEGSGVGSGEHLVVVPRHVLISAGWTPPYP